jgi:hypothetical protein
LSLIILPIAIPLKEVKEPAIMILPSGCINEQYTFPLRPKLNEVSTVPSGFNRLKYGNEVPLKYK